MRSVRAKTAGGVLPHDPNSPARLMGLLEQLLGEVRAQRFEIEALRLAVERISPPSRVSRLDRVRLTAVLPVLHAEFQDEPFKTCEAYRRSAARVHLDDWSTRAVGRFFARCDGEAVGLLYLRSIGREGKAHLWQVRCFDVLGIGQGFPSGMTAV